MRFAIQSMRVHIKNSRQQDDEFERGKMAGLKLALAFLDGAPGTKSMIEAGPGGCPDCLAPLANDGSCCDACGWIKGGTT